ncbi:MAG TPA: NosD domain-containing protein [Candidatus Polarisedimenticolia bacterium]|nr:NosD domain-containing protein [Candidatus Polarisedimenticolia bacterium]
MRRSYVVLPAFVLALFVAQPLFAATYYVGSCKKGAFNTISDAIATVPAGSTINICPGNYPEQVVISKALNLHGICSGNSCQATVYIPSGGLVTTSSITYYGTTAAQIQVTAGPVNISSITVNGQALGSDCPSYPYIGVFYSSGSSGTVSNVETLYQWCQPFGRQSQGIGIVAENGTGVTQSVTIENSNINDFSDAGIVVNSGQEFSPSLTFVVRNNWVTGGNYGIMSLGSAQGIISGNVTQLGLAGVYAGAPNVTVLGNTLLSGSIGIEIYSPAVTVSSNRIFNNFQAGISLQSTNDTVQNNTIMQVPIGIEFNCNAQTSGNVTGNIINGVSTGLGMVPSGFAGVNKFFGVANVSTGCP